MTAAQRASLEAQITIANPARRFGRGFLRFWCRCPSDAIELVTVIAGNGAKQYRPRCLACGHVAGFHFPHRLLTDAERESARIVRTRVEANLRCERCGKSGPVEIHHWAPRSRFPDADQWPTAQLCRDCHARWHQAME
jgi:hypothetical protein